MTGLFLAISFFWLFPTICHTVDIPLQSALLIRGEPVGFTRSTHRQKRSESGKVNCTEAEYNPRNAKHCCNKCLAGYKVDKHCSKDGMKTTCTPCETGTYRKSPNPSNKCTNCDVCLEQFGQIVLQPCTAKNNTICGCPAGQYRSDPGRKFTCLPCSKCENGFLHHPCTVDRNTECTCFINFYLDSTKTCRSCDECNDTDNCTNHCPIQVIGPKVPETNVVAVVLAGVMSVIILALVTTIIVKKRQKLISAFKKKSSLPISDISGSSQQNAPLMGNSNSTGKLDPLPGHSVYVVEEPGLQQDILAQNSQLPLPDITLQTKTPCLASPEVLYKIIECIPVGRWTEFMRRLGVSNHVIDTSERDHRHYKEAQYAMLLHWVHNAGAVRDVLFRVLREMNLGGCVERIEESL